MAIKLTDTIVKDLPTPTIGNKITYDDAVRGFGVRVTAGGARAFILNYRTTAGRERRFTIGSYPDWKTGPAREEAKDLKKRIDVGEDPMGETEAERAAKTVADMIERFEEEHLPDCRPSTAANYKIIIAKYIKPELKQRKVKDVDYSDIDGLRRKVSKIAPYQANRTLAVLSKMFSLAIQWRWRTDNPVKGVKRNQENKRRRYLDGDELSRLTEALTAHNDQQAANIVRLLLLTGSRRGEVLAARWDQFDLKAGTWAKPAATTKQKADHSVPLSAPARLLLADLKATADEDADFVFPSRGESGHRVEIKKDWAALCKVAKIKNARVHDLRHTFASVLVSGGASLPLVGALLGHTQTQTTARYSHLFDDPLRAATERVGAIVTGKPSGEIVPMKGAR
jgi:integrase